MSRPSARYAGPNAFTLQLRARAVYWQQRAAVQSAIVRDLYGTPRAAASQALSERCYARARALAEVARGDYENVTYSPEPPWFAPRAQLELPC